MKRHSEVIPSNRRKNERRHLTLLGQSAVPLIRDKNQQEKAPQDLNFKSIRETKENIGAIKAIDELIKKHQLLENSLRELMEMQYSNAVYVDEGFNFKEEFEPLIAEEPTLNKCPVIMRHKKSKKTSVCPILSQLQNIEESKKRITKNEWKKQKNKSALIKLEPISFGSQSFQVAEESLRDKLLRNEDEVQEITKLSQKQALPKGDFSHDYDGKQIPISKNTERKQTVSVSFNYLFKKARMDQRMFKNTPYIFIGVKSERKNSKNEFRSCLTRGEDCSDIKHALENSFAHCHRVRIQQLA